MPEAIDHVGIIVYNRLLEYGHSGVLKSSVSRTYQSNIFQCDLIYFGVRFHAMGKTPCPSIPDVN